MVKSDHQKFTAIIQAIALEVWARVEATEVMKTELNSGYILEVEVIRFVNMLDVECEVKETL